MNWVLLNAVKNIVVMQYSPNLTNHLLTEKKSFFPLHNPHNQRGWVAAEQLTEDQLISWVRNHKSRKQEKHGVTNAKTKPPGAWAGRTSLNTNIALEDA